MGTAKLRFEFGPNDSKVFPRGNGYRIDSNRPTYIDIQGQLWGKHRYSGFRGHLEFDFIVYPF